MDRQHLRRSTSPQGGSSYVQVQVLACTGLGVPHGLTKVGGNSLEQQPQMDKATTLCKFRELRRAGEPELGVADDSLVRVMYMAKTRGHPRLRSRPLRTMVRSHRATGLGPLRAAPNCCSGESGAAPLPERHSPARDGGRRPSKLTGPLTTPQRTTPRHAPWTSPKRYPTVSFNNTQLLSTT